MKAVVQERFGPPESLQVIDVDKPTIGPDEVMVRIHAASLNPYDWHMLRGDPYVARLLGGIGLTKPKEWVAGIDGAGVVETVGGNVHDLQLGDAVFGFCPGAFAQYARANADLVVRKPESLSFEQAATLPIAATTALRGMRDVAKLEAGQRVLIIGASGGVGSFAVQVAKALGADVTGVCSTPNVDMVRGLGASRVIDYKSETYVNDNDARYDVILDNVGSTPPKELCTMLTPNGTLLYNAGGSPGHVFGAMGSFFRIMAMNLRSPQHLLTLPTRMDRDELLMVVDLVDAGELAPVIDEQRFTLDNAAAGVAYIETGHVHGKAVITVEP